MQTEQQKQENCIVALQYYEHGVKIKRDHEGCIFNSACCYYLQGKYANAEKWFNLAIKVRPSWQDCYFGSCISSLKLGKYVEAYEAVKKLTEMGQEEWTATMYSQEQAVFLKAVCARLLGDTFEAESKEIY